MMSDVQQIRRMRLASLIEASTLAALVFIAVPLKHLCELPQVTAVMGPVHGLAFVFYIWTLLQTASGGTWPRSTIMRMVVCALIPLAGFINERLLWREEQRLSI